MSKASKKRTKRTRRVDPTRALLRIKDYFVKKVFQDFPELSFEAMIQSFFLVHTRHLYFSKATTDFKMPGRLAEGNGSKRESRSVRINDPLIIRIDDTKPHYNEVVFKEQTFILGNRQYRYVRNRMRIVC